MKKIKTKFKDLFVVNANVFKDKRGWLKEEFKKNFIKKDLVFTLVSSSKKNVLRGLHMQTKKPQDKFLSVLKGKVLDVAVDLRKNSPSYGNWLSLELSEDNKNQLWIPPGFAHGFQVLSDTADFEYMCTDYYDPDDEGSLAWNDEHLKINWPIIPPILSSKDKMASSFTNLDL